MSQRDGQSISHAVSGHVSNVATAMEEMTSCIREISKNTTAVSDVASSAVSEAESAGGTVARLNDSAQRISTVVTLISDIADTTRLLPQCRHRGGTCQ